MADALRWVPRKLNRDRETKTVGKIIQTFGRPTLLQPFKKKLILSV